MKLSEAIRLGSILGPQIFGSALGDNGGSCAFGAAILCLGLTVPETGGVHALLQPYPWLKDLEVSCPKCGHKARYACVVHLNDSHRWSRERIADWVASIEPKEETVEVQGEVESLHV